MAANETNSLFEAVEAARSTWLPHGPGDTNTLDVYLIAQAIMKIPNLRLPQETPAKTIGVEMVDVVEARFIQGTLVRNVPNEELSQRAWSVANEVLDRNYIPALAADPPGDPAKACAIALYTWHGCICLAKCFRLMDSRGYHLSIEDRLATYKDLAEQARGAAGGGRRWVEYGMSLARPLEEKRGNAVLDSWVPKDSPYFR